MVKKVSSRIFVVGCSRSGTTLLQVILARHDRIQSFPETMFFLRAARGRIARTRARFGLAGGNEKQALAETADRIGVEPALIQLHHQPFLFKTGAEAFQGMLDRIAIRNEKAIWLEKSPLHVHYTDLIERHIEGAKFVHIVRKGEDVVASIVDRGKKNPKWAYQADPFFGVRRWNRAIKSTGDVIGNENHFVIMFEDLVENPQRTVEEVCRFIGVPYDPEMIDGSADAGSIIDGKPWLKASTGHIEPPRDKFSQLFSPETQVSIQAALDTKEYNRIVNFARSHQPARSRV